jgi:hypothetical protein
MSKKIVAFEPAFGGIVSVLGAAILCFVLFALTSPHPSYISTAFLSIFCVRAIYWGIAQIVGYRKAKRDNIEQQPPALGTALGCVLLGLLLALVTVFLYEFSPNHLGYTIASGSLAALLLFIGAVVGIRQGVWRKT